MAYARALQHWVEQSNLPAGGWATILAKSMLELREEVKWYLSFTNEEFFWGAALPVKERRRVLKNPFHCRHSQGALCARACSGRESPKVFGMGESTTPIPSSGGHWGDPQPTKASRPKVGSSQLSQMIPIQPSASPLRTPTPPKPSLPAQALALMQLPTLPCGFSGVMACLQDARTCRGGP